MSSRALRLLALSIAIGCTGWAHARVPHTTRADRGVDFVPSPRAAQAAAFGFDALVADYHWLQAIQVAGGQEMVDETAAIQLGKLVDVVTTLNPHVDHPYRFAALWLTHSPELVREGNRLLERGIAVHPEDWRNRFYLGFNHFFYLGEYDEAAQALEIAMQRPGSPAYLPRLVARLKSHRRNLDVAETFLREMLAGASDEDAAAHIQSSLDEIEIERKARLLDKARRVYRRRTGREIGDVAELARGEDRVLEKIPSPEPDAIPASLRRGSVWRIDPETKRFVSSYLGSRYEVHYSSWDRARLERWRTADAVDAPDDETVLEDRVEDEEVGPRGG